MQCILGLNEKCLHLEKRSSNLEATTTELRKRTRGKRKNNEKIHFKFLFSLFLGNDETPIQDKRCRGFSCDDEAVTIEERRFRENNNFILETAVRAARKAIMRNSSSQVISQETPGQLDQRIGNHGINTLEEFPITSGSTEAGPTSEISPQPPTVAFDDIGGNEEIGYDTVDH